LQHAKAIAVGVVAVIALGVAFREKLFAHHPKKPEAAAQQLLSSRIAGKRRREIHVPRLTETLVLNGEMDEPAWHATPVTKFSNPDGTESRPYNDVRFLWSSDGILHVGLYASDLNIVTAGVSADGPLWRGDSFHLVFSKDSTEHSFDVGPGPDGGLLTDGERTTPGPWNYAWQSGARVACDMDEGTIDNPKDKDEEDKFEMEIPLPSLGLKPEAGQRIDVVARRCDIGQRGGPPLESPCPETDILGLVFDP
jgi:hypothetical protein